MYYEKPLKVRFYNKNSIFKGTSADVLKTVAELFGKNNWRQIYKQTNLTFYTSNNVCKWCWEEKLLWHYEVTPQQSGSSITFKWFAHKTEKN